MNFDLEARVFGPALTRQAPALGNFGRAEVLVLRFRQRRERAGVIRAFDHHAHAISATAAMTSAATPEIDLFELGVGK